MVLPGPQGTVQYPIGAPNEHLLHTKIMEKSLALFFYCYQGMVHLQSSLSLTPLSSQFPLFPSVLPLSVHPCPLCRSLPLSCFPTLPCGLWFVGYKGRRVYPSKLHPICSGFSSVLSMSPFSLLCKQSLLSMLKKWCNGHHSQTRKKNGAE